MDKRDVGLFRDNWSCTYPSQDRLQTFNGSTALEGLHTQEGGGMLISLCHHIELMEVSVLLHDEKDYEEQMMYIKQTAVCQLGKKRESW